MSVTDGIPRLQDSINLFFFVGHFMQRVLLFVDSELSHLDGPT